MGQPKKLKRSEMVMDDLPEHLGLSAARLGIVLRHEQCKELAKVFRTIQEGDEEEKLLTALFVLGFVPKETRDRASRVLLDVTEQELNWGVSRLPSGQSRRQHLSRMD